MYCLLAVQLGIVSEDALAIWLPSITGKIVVETAMVWHAWKKGLEEGWELASVLPRLQLLGKCKLQAVHNLPKGQIGITRRGQSSSSGNQSGPVE